MTIETEVLETGCVRQKTAGRGAYELMSPFALEGDAKLLEWGAEHRGLRNWEKGMPFSRCIQSIFRHLVKYMMQEPDEDHDDNLAAIRFHAAALMHYEEMILRGLLPATLDDRPSYTPKVSGTRVEGDTSSNDVTLMVATGFIPIPVPSVAEPLRIYVAGPITATTQEKVDANYKRGQKIGDELEALGHLVFVPHRYEVPCEGYAVGTGRLAYETFLRLDLSLIEHWANALFFVGSSPGADRERALAESLGYPIYERVCDVPKLEECVVDRDQCDPASC